MLNQLHPLFRLLSGCCLHITLCLFLFQMHTSCLSPVPPPIPAAPHPSFTPTVWELDISSNNNCNSAYAVDNDRIICTFTTMEPCFPIPAFTSLFSSRSGPCISSESEKPHFLLFHPENDFRHWTCIYQIQNGDVPDQTSIMARFFLDEIFHEGYRHYGPNPAVTYYAPIRFSFTIHYPEKNKNITAVNRDIQLEIISNHPIDFLPPEEFKADTRTCWSVSVIDQAGNGPCCITISLEDNCCLLYNFRHVRDNVYIFSFILEESG